MTFDIDNDRRLFVELLDIYKDKTKSLADKFVTVRNYTFTHCEFPSTFFVLGKLYGLEQNDLSRDQNISQALKGYLKELENSSINSEQRNYLISSIADCFKEFSLIENKLFDKFVEIYLKTSISLSKIEISDEQKASLIYNLARTFKKSSPEFALQLENRFLLICDNINLEENLKLAIYVNKIFKERNAPQSSALMEEKILSTFLSPVEKTSFQEKLKEKNNSEQSQYR